ncbi:DUF6893 family small protein [Streptomyces albidus (ex Kaewkla and Franco 2022)]|nr:hypothetical protein [Streptomyces albidus (ex Kaewkla and Franco 2022)]
MRKGIFIPAAAVRVAMGTLAVAAVVMAAVNTPDVMRYIKMKSM